MPKPYTEIVELIERTIGMALMEDNIERTLIPFAAERARQLGLWSADVYLRHLRSQPQGADEWLRVIGAVTNGQTCFFRDADQFDSLEVELRRLSNRHRDRPIDIWSSGCSTGEEPYSIAILCAEMGVSARILGSDVNPASLARADSAVYQSWALRNVSEQRRARWFTETPEGFRVDARCRERVTLVPHNLVLDPMLSSSAPGGHWQVVLCRNVLIYFRRDRVARVCQRLVASLVDGGLFLVAASETLSGLDVPARPEMVGSRVVYRKINPDDADEVSRRISVPTASRTAAAAVPRIASASPGPGAAPQARPAVSADAAESMLDRVAKLAIDGDTARARSILIAASGGSEGSLETHLTLGHIHLCEHDLDGALESYRKASAIDSLLCEVHYFVGLVHRKRRDWSAAAEALNRALFLAPTFWHASYLLVGAYLRLGREADTRREQTRTRDLLGGPPPIVTFISHPLFVERFAFSADEVCRLMGIPPPRERV